MSALALAPGQGVVWLSVGQAARRLGVSRTVVRRLIDDRKLTVRRIGYWPRVPAHELAALEDSSTTPATPAEAP
jgi:excisionase family DNA binding protein